MTLMNDHAAAVGGAGAQPIYLSCSAEDLIGVEMKAWESGFNQAGIEALDAPQNIAAIGRAAEQVCDRSLVQYVPLDLDRYRDVFIRAWCAGYCMARDRREKTRRREATNH